MLTKIENMKAFESFLERFDKDITWKNDLLDIDKYKLKNLEGAEPRWLLYHLHSLDFVREIVSSLNRFRYYIARLSSWCEVIKSYSDEDKLELIIDYIYPLAIVDMDYPYKIRNRIIYSGCYLCYFSNHLLKNNPTKPLPADESINYKVFKSITTGWTNFIELNNALVAMNSSSFREKTNNFRNSEHHTIPPAIEIGQTRLLRRVSSEKGKQTYSLGGQPPLPLKDLVGLLEDEHRHAVHAFRVLCFLMEEQRNLFECNPTTG